jgi:hypothetical protein
MAVPLLIAVRSDEFLPVLIGIKQISVAESEIFEIFEHVMRCTRVKHSGHISGSDNKTGGCGD